EAGRIAPALAEAQATFLVQDLVNTPAEDMGPAALEAAAEALAKQHGAKVKVTRGDALEQEFPMVDRKSTRLNSSHDQISYAVFCNPRHLPSFPTRRSSDLRPAGSRRRWPKRRRLSWCRT